MGLRAVSNDIEEENELEFKDGDGGGFLPSDLKIEIEVCDNGYFLRMTEEADGVKETIKEVYDDYTLLMVRLAEVLKPMG